MGYRRTYGFTRQQKAALFGLFLLTILAVSLITALTTTGPVVLGTEMNTNGMVEYLCLGRDCDNLF